MVMMKKKGQISVEYMIVVGFVSFLVVSVLGVGFFYSSTIRDRIKFNQIDGYANKLTSGAESVFYAGEPSKSTLDAYLPAGVTAIEVNGKDIIFNISTSSGLTRIAYSSNVNLQGNLSNKEGIHKIVITAQDDGVFLSPG